jgi:raffinose/stachyose/melibiose transport system permease protein
MSRLARELALIVAAVLVLFPLYVLLALSLKTPAAISRASIAPPRHIDVDNYRTAWHAATLGGALVNSAAITAASLLALVLLGSLAAFHLARAGTRASYRLYLLFLLGMTLPFQLAMIPLFTLVRSAGLLGGYAGVIGFSTGMQLPFTVFLYTGFLRAQPREYGDAALVDGASQLQTFIHVIFPLLRPVTATVIALNAVVIWNDFLTPLLYLGGSANETVPVVVFRFVGQYNARWGPIFAAVVLATIPLLAGFALLRAAAGELRPGAWLTRRLRP